MPSFLGGTPGIYIYIYILREGGEHSRSGIRVGTELALSVQGRLRFGNENAFEYHKFVRKRGRMKVIEESSES